MTTHIELKRILFLCSENSCLSQMAKAFARRHGNGRVDARSAGFLPLIQVDQKAIEVMREKGYDLGGHRTKFIEEVATGQYDVAVTIDCNCECPNGIAKRHEDWDIPKPREMSLDFLRSARNLIEKKVKSLLERLYV